MFPQCHSWFCTLLWINLHSYWNCTNQCHLCPHSTVIKPLMGNGWRWISLNQFALTKPDSAASPLKLSSGILYWFLLCQTVKKNQSLYFIIYLFFFFNLKPKLANNSIHWHMFFEMICVNCFFWLFRLSSCVNKSQDFNKS